MSNFVKIPFISVPIDFKRIPARHRGLFVEEHTEEALAKRAVSDYVRGGISADRARVRVRDASIAPQPPHEGHPDFQNYAFRIERKDSSEGISAADVLVLEDVLLRWGFHTDAPGCRGERAVIFYEDEDFAVGDTTYCCKVDLGTAVWLTKKTVTVGYPSNKEEFIVEMTALQKLLWEEGFMVKEISGYFGVVCCGVSSEDQKDTISSASPEVPDSEQEIAPEAVEEEFKLWKETVVKTVISKAIVALESPVGEFELALDDITEYIRKAKNYRA